VGSTRFGPAVVLRARPGDVGGEGDASSGPAAVRICGGTGVRVRADRLPSTTAAAGFPRCAETLGPGPFASECLSHPKAAVRGGKGVLAMSIRCGVVVSLLRDHGMIDVLVRRA